MVKVIIGTQWGDEGKGRVSALKLQNASMAVRATGGSNAGHTVVHGKEKYALHLLPSSIVEAGKKSVISHGVTVDPEVLVGEIRDLRKRGISVYPGELFISSRATVDTCIHREMDVVQEEMRGDKKVGTTKRGIGPSYQDKDGRYDIRMMDLLGSYDSLYRRFELLARFHNPTLISVGHEPYTDEFLHQICEKYLELGRELSPYITETIPIVDEAIMKGEEVVLEGAQSVFLDLDMGTRPYVTSSHPTASGTCDGAGVGPLDVDEIIGVMKAYCSRVGEGPFPTEQDNEIGNRIRELGHEYGTTTGRPRRCGWLDLVMIRHVAKTNSLRKLSGKSERRGYLAVNHVDTIGTFDEFNVCVGYKYRGKEITYVPFDHDNCEPIYQTFKGGWKTEGATTLEDLGPDAVKFINFIEDYTGVPVKYIGIGPDAKQTIIRDV